MRCNAILILGPTGSGKTPLGDLLEEQGLGNGRCCHFDFGTQLRAVINGIVPSRLFSDKEIARITTVLTSGALLEDHDFPIAQKIFLSFIRRKRIAREDIIILNGLPRHVGQADEMDSFVDMKLVVHLACTAETVLGRIRTNVGKDRTNRTDDDLASVTNRIARFDQRTTPLIDYYRLKTVPIKTITVTGSTTPSEILDFLQDMALQ